MFELSARPKGYLNYYGKRLALSAVSMVVLTTILEFGLRFFPVAMSLRPLPKNVQNPILRFEPNRRVTWSWFPDFSMARQVRVNNYGFVNDVDYVKKDSRSLVAVVGDSYVEALHVPTPETLHGRLAKAVGKDFRVYSFGSSGTPLSGYLGYAKWIRAEFGPKKMVIVVVGNDFDESLTKYRTAAPRYLHDFFEEDDSGELMWQLGHYEPSTTRKILGSFLEKSHLAMYLLQNLSLNQRLANLSLIWGGDMREDYVGNTAAAASQSRLQDSRRAVDAFLRLLPDASGLLPRNIAIVVDAMRPQVYSQDQLDAAHSSYFGKMRLYLLNQAEVAGFFAIDLEPAFQFDWKQRGMRFEFDRDGHWNAEGHRVAATALLATGFLNTK